MSARDRAEPTVRVRIDGRAHTVAVGTTIAAAILNAQAERGDAWRLRTSIGGDARGPLCGVGACFECRVTVDGRAHRRACRLPCRDGMEIGTGHG